MYKGQIEGEKLTIGPEEKVGSRREKKRKVEKGGPRVAGKEKQREGWGGLFMSKGTWGKTSAGRKK